MTYKTILVHLNYELRAPELIAAAAHIARPTEAHVIGLYVAPPLYMPSDIVMPMGSDLYERQVANHKDQAERIKTLFNRLTSGEPFVSDWRSVGDLSMAYEPIANSVVVEARAADLVIVSQSDGDDPPQLSDIPHRTALESGRPVLVVPTKWPATAYGQNVSIAWNNSREAARAAFDALPFLRRAKAVTLMTVGEDDDDGSERVTAADIAASLARHGVRVQIDSIKTASSGPASAALLARAAAHGSDLLVMGAYGHSRMREFILGGATRYVLKNMTMPVLISH